MKKKDVLVDPIKICHLIQECFSLNAVEMAAGFTALQTFYATCMEDLGLTFAEYCHTLEQAKISHQPIWDKNDDDLTFSS